MAPSLIAIIGAGIGAGGEISKGIEAKRQAEAQADVAEFNARVAQRDADAQRQAAAFKQRRQAKAGAAASGRLLAQLGASGVVPGEGAPLLLEAGQVAESELETLLIGREGEIRAQRFETQAALDIGQADIFRLRGKKALQQGFIKAGTSFGTSLLTGFGGGTSRGTSRGTPSG